MILLRREEVRALLDPEALIDAVATALVDVSAGTASVPPRIAALTPLGLLGAMVGYVPSLGVLAAKLVAVFPQNAGMPTHRALIAVFDPRTGTPVAVLDGEEITAQRTAAASALATRLLAREEAAVLALVGTGVQAASHARYVARVRRFRTVLVAGRDPAKAAKLAAEIGGQAAAIEEAVRSADVICATTHAREPVVRMRWVRPGTHVNSVGLNPQGQELDGIGGALLAVESRASAFAAPPAGANELRGIAPETAVELGALVSGSSPGRTSREQVTAYKSVGIAAEDAAAAALVLRRARETGVGTPIEM
ncbi:MAG: ornithine cyclodeaminase family protein [Deltaproteobacteria bacterium]|nr:MAG: ornithine cyclodeaminase family protein [Deltaproteobacteria bacterium]TMB40972.1 MAG: ornithine cyclodeaminase family protein [Deltaproteobacteria bacterium]